VDEPYGLMRERSLPPAQFRARAIPCSSKAGLTQPVLARVARRKANRGEGRTRAGHHARCDGDERHPLPSTRSNTPLRPHSKGVAALRASGQPWGFAHASAPRAPAQSSCGCAHHQTAGSPLGAVQTTACGGALVGVTAMGYARSPAHAPTDNVGGKPRDAPGQRALWTRNCVQHPQSARRAIPPGHKADSQPFDRVRRPCHVEPVPRGGAHVATRQGQLHGRIEMAASGRERRMAAQSMLIPPRTMPCQADMSQRAVDRQRPRKLRSAIIADMDAVETELRRAEYSDAQWASHPAQCVLTSPHHAHVMPSRPVSACGWSPVPLQAPQRRHRRSGCNRE